MAPGDGNAPSLYGLTDRRATSTLTWIKGLASRQPARLGLSN
jgi:hypothetical protein